MEKNKINDENIKKYAEAMGEINVRINSIKSLYDHVKILPKIPEPIIIESAALQIRKVLELVAFASLVTHEQIYSETFKNIDKEWHAINIIRKMEKINPHFYPVSLFHEETSQTVTERTNNYLTKNKFTELYGRCGNILHRPNPFKVLLGDRYYQEYADFIYESVESIKNLLEIHAIQLINDDIVWVIHMNSNADGVPSYHPFKPSEKLN